MENTLFHPDALLLMRSTNSVHPTDHILASPSVHARLRAELLSAIPDPSSIPPLAVLEKLPYLSAIIHEVHRFAHGVVGRLERVSPDAALHYRHWVIPPGTPVSMTSLLQHRDPSIFPEPLRFDPERWLKGKESTALERYLVPFSKGTRQCLGINLATAEIYLTLATVFRRFDNMRLWQTTARDAEVVSDFFIPHGHAESKGVRVVFG